MAKINNATLRVVKKSAFKKEQLAKIKGLLKEMDIMVTEFGTLNESGGQLGVVTCGPHACEGFEPGGGGTAGCVSEHSSCKQEACAPNECRGHTCSSEACSGQGEDDCDRHVCTENATTEDALMSMMKSASPAFRALVGAQRKLGHEGISLSID